MEKITRVAISIICTLLPVAPITLIAHPGHGQENPLSPGHYVANPEHFLPLAITIGAALIAVVAYRYHVSKSNKQ